MGFDYGTAKQWVKNARNSGRSEDYIRAEMLRKNYSSESINSLLRETRENKKIPFKKYLIYGAIAIFALFILWIAVNYFSGMFVKEQTCTDDDCFISLANGCLPVKMEKIEVEGVYDMSSEKCVFTKKLVRMNETEETGVRQLIEGTSMTCQYDRGNFDENLITTMSIGIENCEGDLREGIGQLAGLF